MSANLPMAIPPGSRTDLGWATIMRGYVADGYAARLGPYGTAVLVALAAATDFTTGEIGGLGVREIARCSGMSQRAARTALAALRKAGWLEELPGRKNGQQARYRLLNRAGISKADGQRIGEFVWPHVPHAAQDDRAAIRELLEKGQLPKKVGGQINIHLHFEAGSVGIVMTPPATSPTLQVIDHE
jgi:DNA-binding transcriptional ArsR family regulator